MLGNEPHKNSRNHIDASHSRQPLVKGERLVRYEVNAVMPLSRPVARRGQLCHVFQCAMFLGMHLCGRVGSGAWSFQHIPDDLPAPPWEQMRHISQCPMCPGMQHLRESGARGSAPSRCSPGNLQNVHDDLTRFSHAGGRCTIFSNVQCF